MRRGWKIAAVASVVAILGVVVLGAVVLAQEPQNNGQGVFADLRQQMHQALAKALGISVDQYDAAVTTARDEVLSNAVKGGTLTQSQADAIRERAAQGDGLGLGMMGGRGRGMMGGYGFMMGDGSQSLIAVAADKLGMTVAEVQTQLQGGKTIAALAQEKNVDVQTIIDAFVAGRQEWLNQAVADGRLTQAQADQMLENMRTMAANHVNGSWSTWGPGQGGCPMGGGRQGRPGGRMNQGSGTF